MVMNHRKGKPVHTLQPVLTRSELTALQEEVARTHVADSVIHYIVSLIRATRTHEQVQQGASPRATLAVADMARAMAQLQGRDYVLPSDVQEVFAITVAHRLTLTPRAEAAGVTAMQVLQEILKKTASPKLG